MSKRIGPSMSTEPGWTARQRHSSSYLEEVLVSGPNNDPSMLLSFERPASSGRRVDVPSSARPKYAGPDGVTSLSTVLENCTEATSAAIDKRRLKTGITGFSRAGKSASPCSPQGAQEAP